MSLRVHNVKRGAPIQVWLDGAPAQAYLGETVATVLWANGRMTFRHTPRGHAPRGLFCGIGLCHDCLVTVDGVPNVRACLTPIRPGMRIETDASLVANVERE